MKLKAAIRNALPASKFAAPKQVAKGNLSSTDAAKIRAKASAIMGGK